MRAMLDASSMIADLLGEPQQEVYLHALDNGAFMSAANLAEVATRLVMAGVPSSDIHDIATRQNVAVVPLTEDIALMAAELVPVTKQLGLSLADRCCLATAAAFDATHVLTTDRAWLELPSPLSDRIVLTRPD